MDSLVKNVYHITAQQRMWKSMRIMKQFSLVDLQVTARGEEELLNEETTRSYINFLISHNYVERIGRDAFRLLKNTGCWAPQVKRGKHLYDDNICKEFEYPKKVRYKDLLHDYISNGKAFIVKDLPDIVGCSFNYAKECVQKLKREGKLEIVERIGKEGTCIYIFKKED